MMNNLTKLFKTEDISIKQVAFPNWPSSTNAYFKLSLYVECVLCHICETLWDWSWCSLLVTSEVQQQHWSLAVLRRLSCVSKHEDTAPAPSHSDWSRSHLFSDARMWFNMCLCSVVLSQPQIKCYFSWSCLSTLDVNCCNNTEPHNLSPAGRLLLTD